MKRKSWSSAGENRRKRGFERASGVLESQIRNVSESRGFAVSRLLTHWSEIVGDAVASAAIPVKVSYSQGGFGATLTLLTTGAQAPMLQAELPKITERVNACYGYSAIARIRLTQTAPTGFAEGQVAFDGKKPAKASRAPGPVAEQAAKQAVAGVDDLTLRKALESLGANVLSRSVDKKGT